MFKRFRFIYAILIGVILAMLLVYVRLPYYVTKPGMAAKLEPYVQVEGGTKESGDFMLVTVSMGPANVVNLIAAQFNKYTHISKAEEILQHPPISAVVSPIRTDELYCSCSHNFMVNPITS